MADAILLGKGFASCDWMEDVETEGDGDVVLFGCDGRLKELGSVVIVEKVEGCMEVLR